MWSAHGWCSSATLADVLDRSLRNPWHLSRSCLPAARRALSRVLIGASLTIGTRWTRVCYRWRVGVCARQGRGRGCLSLPSPQPATRTPARQAAQRERAVGPPGGRAAGSTTYRSCDPWTLGTGSRRRFAGSRFRTQLWRPGKATRRRRTGCERSTTAPSSRPCLTSRPPRRREGRDRRLRLGRRGRHGLTATPHGYLPTPIDFVTVSESTSMMLTSLLTPFVA